jgi:hypothetical protein
VSDSAELAPLAASPVVALRYDYRETALVDGHGNAFRYVARSRMRSANGSVRPCSIDYALDQD